MSRLVDYVIYLDLLVEINGSFCINFIASGFDLGVVMKSG